MSGFGTSEADLKSTYRRKRFQIVLQMIKGIVEEKGTCEVIDLGGRYSYWEDFESDLAGLPIRIRITNLGGEIGSARHPPDDRFTFEVADARDCPQYPDFSFDLVHSNSVIEHVGRWRDMAAMAKEVRRLAPAYFVQTPYFWFPIEPHYRAPFVHWLPEPWRLKMLMKRRLGFYGRAESTERAMESIEDAKLLDLQQFHSLFPDAEIIKERVLGLTKSMVAVRHKAHLATR